MLYRQPLRAWTLAILLILQAGPARGLPINFGINEGDIEYREIKSENFYVYHDARTPGEGAMMLHALEGARPVMERWFQVRRDAPLPVIMSAVSSNASFANFITDAVELQTLGQGTRDLAWHEYVHSTMYRTVDNWFGPAGALIHLPWMPVWFIEGLAEALSVSLESDVTAGIERYHALTGHWPTYDRLHSLYGKSGFAQRGYATSGALVSYLLRRGDADHLPTLLDDFHKYSMPWWWPWAAVPFNGFMPMDTSLENFAELNGERLYEQYKKDATAFWKKYGKGPFLMAMGGPRRRFSTLAGLQTRGHDLVHLIRMGDKLWDVNLEFDPKTGWVHGYQRRSRLPDAFDSFARTASQTYQTAVSYEAGDKGFERSKVLGKARGAEDHQILAIRDGVVTDLFDLDTHIAWLEVTGERSQLCLVAKGETRSKVRCPINAKQPRKLRVLGARPDPDNLGQVVEIWLHISEETVLGNRNFVAVFDAKSEKIDLVKRLGARPVQVAFTGDDVWMVSAERSYRTLRRLSGTAECQGVLHLRDHILSLHGLPPRTKNATGELVVGLYGGSGRYLKKLSMEELEEEACYEPDDHISPLLYALRQDHPVSLSEAMRGANLWQKDPQPLGKKALAALTKRPALDRDLPPEVEIDKRSKPAKWRGRPVLAFPWIGAEDALGPQFGIVSVPIMDHMQNETVRATFLYGAHSRFPYQELALLSTRFEPTVSLAVYRQQTYNGLFYQRSTGRLVSSYLDEKGLRYEMDDNSNLGTWQVSWEGGVKVADLKPYLGPYLIRKGTLVESALSLSISHGLWDAAHWSSSVLAKAAPAGLNDHFDYNQVGLGTTVSFSLPFSSAGLIGVEMSRTRGKKRRELQEVYRPLKTFVPGSGGGYNKNSFPLVDGDGLFSPVFGDSQARAKANWTVPIISDIDKLIWILYMERLDFTAFYNYGGAWHGREPRRGWEHLIRAHGYNLDLQLENKGVRFNGGLGTGQVVGRNFEVYVTLGFDALF